MINLNKIYVIYLRNEGGSMWVYGWTRSRALAMEFIFTRDIKKFKVKKLKKTTQEMDSFLDFNKDKELTNIYLYDGKTDVSIIGTTKEEYQLSVAIDIISDKISESVSILNSFISKEEMNKIKDLTIQSVNNKLFINSFKLFYELFIYTFEKKKEFIPFEQQIEVLI